MISDGTEQYSAAKAVGEDRRMFGWKRRWK